MKIFTKILSVVLVISMVFCFLANSASSIFADYSKFCGPNATWRYDTKSKTLTISGYGEMSDYFYPESYYNEIDPSVFPDYYDYYDYNEVPAPWKDYASKIKTVKIESGITYIGKYAFCGLKSLKKVTIPSTVSKIGCYAFAGCYSLEKIALPDNLKEIPMGLFFHCSSLKAIRVPYTVSTIDSSAFNSCESLKKVEVANNIKEIGTNIFSGCESIEKLIFLGTKDEEDSFKQESEINY